MIKFLVFADTHYKKGTYRTQVSDLEKIMKRAADSGAQFVVHCGDFSNDYIDSPEFLRAYLENPYDLPVYGVYGNHELETRTRNTMKNVTRSLCNRPVNFGVPHYDEPDDITGYWYTDIDNYRLIGLDTNYSYNNKYFEGRWMHNDRTAPPDGNHVKDSLSPAQLDWLYERIKEAHEKGMKVITVSHAGFAKITFEWSPDAENVQNIFSKFPGTVVLAMNGHYHTDHCEVQNGVCYFDVNTAINGAWELCDKPHYKDTDTFTHTSYDHLGNPLSTVQCPFNYLTQGWNTWSFKEPLSAVVTIDDNMKITIEGAKTEWDMGLAATPETMKEFYEGIKPEIEDRVIQL